MSDTWAIVGVLSVICLGAAALGLLAKFFVKASLRRKQVILQSIMTLILAALLGFVLYDHNKTPETTLQQAPTTTSGGTYCFDTPRGVQCFDRYEDAEKAYQQQHELDKQQ